VDNKTQNQLIINITTKNNQVENVIIKSSRITNAADIFVGKKIDEVLSLLPLLFSVCGKAQLVTALQAIENFHHLPNNIEIQQYRTASVKMESIKENLHRIYINWADFIKTPQDIKSMRQIMQLQHNFQQILTTDIYKISPQTINIDENKIKKLKIELGQHLKQNIFKIQPYEWLQIKNIQDLKNWADNTTTIAAKMIKFIIDKKNQNIGLSSISPLTTINEDIIKEIIHNKNYIQKPTINNKCYESTSCTIIKTPLLSAISKTYGKAMLHRAVATLSQITLNSENLFNNYDNNNSKQDIKNYEKYGIGTVIAARGKLVHCIKIKNDKIKNYKILAPTEWNFHPQGSLQQMLIGLKGNKKELKIIINMLICLLDPCVDYELNFKKS
jgi:coenzyme F420-reducing hydrogenase alpha subunit